MKALMSTDWHVGYKNNSIQHNQDLLEFVDFLIAYAKENNITTLYHLGDFFHHRDKLDVMSIHYAQAIIDDLKKQFTDIIVLRGNHDLYLRDSRDICSTNIFKEDFELTEFYKIDGDKMFVSWICNAEEWDEVVKVSKKNKIKYMFGHFEFSTFAMNDHYIMEHGSSHKELKHVDKIFTGHYHMRQERDNIVYIGNPFPFDYNDANDLDRGFCVVDFDTGEHEYVNWNKINILSVDSNKFLEETFHVEQSSDNTSVRIIIETDISNDDIDKLKEKLESAGYRDSKIVYKINTLNDAVTEEQTDMVGQIMGIDETVITYIDNMSELENIDKELLGNMYQELIEVENNA